MINSKELNKRKRKKEISYHFTYPSKGISTINNNNNNSTIKQMRRDRITIIRMEYLFENPLNFFAITRKKVTRMAERFSFLGLSLARSLLG